MGRNEICFEIDRDGRQDGIGESGTVSGVLKTWDDIPFLDCFALG